MGLRRRTGATSWCVSSKVPQRRPQSVYFLRHGKILPFDRELWVPDRLLRRGAWDHGNPVPERGHTPGRRGAGPAGSPQPQGRHSLRRPRGHRWQPDRLLGGLPGGTTVRLGVGAPREAHAGAPGVGRRALRAPRRQGRLRGPLLLGLARSRSAGGGHEPHVLGHVRLLQRPGRDGVGYGGGPCGVLLRSNLGCDAALVGTLCVAAGPSTPGGARRLLRLPVGDLPPESVARARSVSRLYERNVKLLGGQRQPQRVKASLNRASSSTNRIRFSIPNPSRRRLLF